MHSRYALRRLENGHLVRGMGTCSRDVLLPAAEEEGRERERERSGGEGLSVGTTRVMEWELKISSYPIAP